MLNLYIDFDGVIMDTIDVSYKMIQDKNIDLKNISEVEKFYRDINWGKLLEKSNAINDSWECIERIIDSNKFNIAILTHVNSLEEIQEKVKVIRKHFRDITIIPVPKFISKTLMLKAEGAILIDDYVYNLEEWKKAGGIGVRFDLDMDGKGFTVIDRLDEIINIFN